MESWQELLRKKGIASLEALAARFGPQHVGDIERLKQAAENFEFRISPAMVDLIREPGDPIWRQYVPTVQELEIRDVIVSGGDPLMLSDRRLDEICGRLRAIPHLEILRIGSRVPCHLPERITPELCDTLKKHHPLYINTHFNHPDELTPEAVKGLGRLADAGIPLGCQTVLLKGVNDDADVMKELMQKLLAARVRPYYIYMCDQVAGAEHFKTSVETGLKIIKALRGWTSGLAVPHFVIDAPGGGGKIPLLPEYLVRLTDEEVSLRNYAGNEYRYTQPLEPILVG